MLPWYFWVIVAAIPAWIIGFPLYVNWRKRRDDEK